jgi:glycosyltransferase involved in cell wall biosynthesis
VNDIVVVTCFFPFPARSGSTVLASQLLPRLAKRHRLHLVCREQPSPEDAAHADGIFASTRFAPSSPSSRASSSPARIRARLLRNLAAGVPTLVTNTASREMPALVDEAVRTSSAAALLSFELFAVQYVPPHLLSRTVANVEDPPSLRLARMLRLAGFTKRERARMALDALASARYERNVLSRAGRVLLLSQADVDDLSKTSALTNLRAVRYGVAVHDEHVQRDARAPGRIVFSGNMFHAPNVDAACFFLNEVFDLVVAQEPTASLAVVGADPDARIREAAARFGDRVTITGRVVDVGAHVKTAMVSVCPVRLKVGVQTKVLEAFSWATPVVTTSDGNSGIAGLDSRDLFVADEPNAFAARVITLLRDVDVWTRLATNGARLAREQFSWDRSASDLEAALDDVARVS